MRVEEFGRLSRNQLRTKANECFHKAETAGTNDRPGLLLEAQFYLRELEHRVDSWTSIRDFILEIVVIFLIGWEIHMGYRQENQQSQNFKDQQQVLTNLQKSSAATAAILASLRIDEYRSSKTTSAVLRRFSHCPLRRRSETNDLHQQRKNERDPLGLKVFQ